MSDHLRERIEDALRRRVPFFGHDGPYCLGSGVVCASGASDGEWTFAVGPDLTGPNFLESETVVIDGKRPPFTTHRLRGCGAFFAFAFEPGIHRTSVFEIAPPDASAILRLLVFENESEESRRVTFEVRVKADPQSSVETADGAVEIVFDPSWV